MERAPNEPVAELAESLPASPLGRAAEQVPRASTGVGSSRLLGLSRVALLLALAWLGLFHFSVVRGSSMVPSIQDGDRIVIDHFSYVVGEVRRGDVAVLRYPLDPSLDYVKRVIGLPGEHVRLAGGRVWIDGIELEEPYVAATDPAARLDLRVAEGHYFVLGDNRPCSSDSREFGLVPRELLVGRVDLRVWPLGRLGPIR